MRPFSTPTQEALLIFTMAPFTSLLQALKPARYPTQETTLLVVWRPSHFALVFTVFTWTVSSFVFHLPDNTVNCCETLLFHLLWLQIIFNLFVVSYNITSDHKSFTI